MMRNFVNIRENNWSSALPVIAAAMNAAHHDSIHISSYQAVTGAPYIQVNCMV